MWRRVDCGGAGKSVPKIGSKGSLVDDDGGGSGAKKGSRGPLAGSCDGSDVVGGDDFNGGGEESVVGRGRSSLEERGRRGGG